MKRLLAAFFILLLASSLVSAKTYTLPGSTSDGKPYNNIGILGEVMVDLNVTVVNTAPFPKFVVVNPRYDFRVLRLSGDERMTSYRANGTTYHVPSSLGRTSLNYYIGFWLMPYETVVVNFRIPYNDSYLLQTRDYRSTCGDSSKLTDITYYNGSSNYTGHIGTKDELSPLYCGVIYPQLVNAPKILSVRSMFPIDDGYVRVLNYRGTVTFRLTNVPNRAGVFNTFFAAALPVIFKGAKTYGFTPNYTMTYREYMDEFIWKYRGVTPPERHHVQVQPLPSASNMFQLSSTLLTGVSVGAPVVRPPKEAGLDFPVWIIFMGSSVEISYHVEWSAGG